MGERKRERKRQTDRQRGRERERETERKTEKNMQHGVTISLQTGGQRHPTPIHTPTPTRYSVAFLYNVLNRQKSFQKCKKVDYCNKNYEFLSQKCLKKPF